MSDETLQCRDCSQDFVFTAGEQEFYKSKGFENKPTRCAACKAQKKNRFDGDRKREYGRERGSYDRYDDREGGRDRYDSGRDRYGDRDRDRTQRKGCFNCGDEGHFSRDCDRPRKAMTCYVCNKEGHISRDCEERREGGGGGDRSCRAFQAGDCRYGNDCRFTHIRT